MIDNRCCRREGETGDGGVTHPCMSYTVGNSDLGFELGTDLRQEKVSGVLVTF
jgi:hypothetical protein